MINGFRRFPAERVALFIAATASLLSVLYSLQFGLILAYNDATAHLNTARRVIDNLTPGIVQLGSVWLPLLHVLQIPFVASDYMWQSGVAGWIVSGISFVVAALFIFKLTYYLTKQVSAAFISLAVMTLNANMLYIQTTAMFEPLLMATAAGAIYYLTRWTVEKNKNYLIFAAFYTMLATLTRYDGWALFIVASGYVLYISILQKHKNKEGALLLFGVLAGFGIVLWFVYNAAIFGDALYFQRGEYSAKAQQDVLGQRDSLPTRYNLPLSVQTYSLAVILNLGLVTSIGLLAGSIYYCARNISKPALYAPMLLLVPYPFNIISLYTGQSVVWMPLLPPYFDTFFNIRYGLLVLPAAAFVIGYMSKGHFSLKFFVIAALIMQMYLFFRPDIFQINQNQIGIVTLRDTVSSVNQQTENASRFLNKNYNGGLILASSASIDAFIFRTGLPLKNWITEGTGKYWTESLQNPTKHATYIVFFQDNTDRVGLVMSKWKYLEEEYELIYEDQTYQIYKRANKL